MSFRKLNAPHLVEKVAEGKKYDNGKEVRVAGTTSGPYVLADLLGAFRRLNPETEIIMRLGRFEELLRMFVKGEIEISLSRLPRSADGYGLQSEVFANVEMAFVVSTKHYLCKQGGPGAEAICSTRTVHSDTARQCVQRANRCLLCSTRHSA
ncbi:MAG: LysR family transcriptional regulator substrate-binding protein [Candidatus Binatia bacterium]